MQRVAPNPDTESHRQLRNASRSSLPRHIYPVMVVDTPELEPMISVPSHSQTDVGTRRSRTCTSMSVAAPRDFRRLWQVVDSAPARGKSLLPAQGALKTANDALREAAAGSPAARPPQAQTRSEAESGLGIVKATVDADRRERGVLLHPQVVIVGKIIQMRAQRAVELVRVSVE